MCSFNRVTWLLVLLVITSCKDVSRPTKTIGTEHELLNEDKQEFDQSLKWQSEISTSIIASLETESVEANSEEDAADDPAIWFNKSNPGQSIVYGSNKKGGLIATNLAGKILKYYELGSINNVDILYDYAINDSTVQLLGCSNRTTQAIDLFLIEADGSLIQYQDSSFYADPNKIDDIYGFCFAQNSGTEEHYIFINGKNGKVQQFQLITSGKNLKLKLVREVQFEGQTEGMVADKTSGKIYIGEEERGIWMMNIDPNESTKVLLAESGEENNSIHYDIEGLTILNLLSESYLIASSQGNFSYAVFDIHKGHKYLGSFKIIANEHIDGVEETDGLDIVSDSLNTQYPMGVFVVQDGFNYNGDTLKAQNFKFIRVENVLKAIRSF